MASHTNVNSQTHKGEKVEARAGVITQVELAGPMATPGGGITAKDLFHPGAPATWSLIWFLIAVLLLFIV